MSLNDIKYIIHYTYTHTTTYYRLIGCLVAFKTENERSSSIPSHLLYMDPFRELVRPSIHMVLGVHKSDTLQFQQHY